MTDSRSNRNPALPGSTKLAVLLACFCAPLLVATSRSSRAQEKTVERKTREFESTKLGDTKSLAEERVPAGDSKPEADGSTTDGFQEEVGSSSDAAETEEAISRRRVWERFVKSMLTADREELVEQNIDGEGHIILPDFASGDPIRGVLFRDSNDLVNLDFLFREDAKSMDAAERQAKIQNLLEKLEAEKSPYLKDYALYYGSRAALERGADEEAEATLRKLVESPRFLGTSEARKHLIGVYRRLGKGTYALLELQSYRFALGEEDGSEQAWVDEQLAEIRESHDGPLHDVSDRSGNISRRISILEVGKNTQGEQGEVEDILRRVADLLEEAARQNPQNMKLQQMTMSQQQKKRQRQQRQRARQKRRQKQMAGQGKPGQKPGEAKSNRPTDNPAESSKTRRGRSGRADLADRKQSGDTPWGEINDREVADSIRKAWTRIPPAYRSLVARYFRDITDVEPEKSRMPRK